MSGTGPRTPVDRSAKAAGNTMPAGMADGGNLLPFRPSARRRDRGHRRTLPHRMGQILLFTGVQIVRHDEDASPGGTSVGR